VSSSLSDVDQDALAHLRSAAERAALRPARFVLPGVRDVIANGIRLQLLEWGPADAPPIVFLHGGSLTAHTWDLVCLVLSEQYRCIAVDLRGHGESEWPANADYTLDAIAADVAALIGTTVERPPVLVGMSLGGLTALLAASRPDVELSGLVVVDIGPRPRVDGVQAIIDFTSEHELDSVDAFVQRALAFNPRRRPELLRRSLLHNLRQLPSGRWAWKWDPRRSGVSRPEQVRAHQDRLWASVSQIHCPTLVLRGERSTVFLDEDAAELAAALADARVTVVPDAGHTVQGDNPRGLLDAVVPFLAQIHGPLVSGY